MGQLALACPSVSPHALLRPGAIPGKALLASWLCPTAPVVELCSAGSTLLVAGLQLFLQSTPCSSRQCQQPLLYRKIVVMYRNHMLSDKGGHTGKILGDVSTATAPTITGVVAMTLLCCVSTPEMSTIQWSLSIESDAQRALPFVIGSF